MENSTDKSKKGKDVFLTMVGLLGLKAEVKDEIRSKNIVLSVSADEPGRLIGRNGSSNPYPGISHSNVPSWILNVNGVAVEFRL